MKNTLLFTNSFQKVKSYSIQKGIFIVHNPIFKSKKVYLFLIVFTLSSLIFSQDVKYGFTEITSKDGLTGNAVTDIHQDKMGFVWIATSNGLSKYDGYKLTNYTNNSSDSNSISGNFCSFIFEDSISNLWVGTKFNGLNYYNRKTNSFSNFEYYIDNKKFSDISDVRTMNQDKKGNLWVGTKTGVLVFSIKNGKITKLNQVVQNFPKIAVNDIYFDDLNKAWIASDNGMYLFNPENKNLTHFESNNKNSNSISNNYVFQIKEDSDDNLWIATKYGLNKYNKKENLFSTFLVKKDSKVNNYAFNIEIDINNNVWVIFPKQGIYQFNQNTKRFIKIVSSNKSISNDLVYGTTLHQDNSGVMWIGTTKKGVKIYRPQFSGIKKHSNDAKSILSSGVSSFLRDSKGNFWITDYNGTLKSIDSNGKENYYNKFLKDGKEFPPHIISSILEGRNGDILLGTGVGLYKFDSLKNNFKYFDITNGNKKLSIVSCLYKDRREVYWIGTYYNGLYSYDPKTKEYNYYQTNDATNSISNNKVSCIQEDINGFIWVGTSNGLNKFDRKNSSFTRFFYNQGASKNENLINSIFEDSKSQLFLATKGGLMLFNNNSFKRIDFDEKISKDEVFSILEDNDKNLWISSIKNLYRYNPKNNVTTSFGAEDNLPIVEFYENIPLKDNNGTLFFGESTGYLEIIPSKMIKNKPPPKISLTNFKVFNNSIPISNEINNTNTFALKKDISVSDTINLNYKDNMFSIEFSALDFVNSNKNLYAYKMQNLNENWIYTDSKNRIATYTNLDYKNYIFKLKAANSEGVWNEEGISLHINVFPPWWKTYWAYFFYILTFLLLLFAFIQWRALRLRKDKKILIKNVEFKTKDLADKNNLLDKQNIQLQDQAAKLQELDKIKASFFANISHEFRTPLTVITGLANKYITNNENEANSQDSQTIKRNAQRLLQLINQLLDLSKLENSQVKLNIRKTDILHFTKKVILLYDSLAKEKSIQVFFNEDALSKSLPAEKIDLYFDKEKMQKIITNLISNAIKFTPENGKINLTLTEKNSNKNKPSVVIKVSNTGVGIPKKKLPFIFDRFYQVENSNTGENEGTGIGLALVKELVELHYGTVEVTSDSKETTFELNFPFNEKLILNNATENKKNEIAETILDQKEKNNKNDTIKIGNQFELDEESSSKLELLIVEDNPDLRSYISGLLEKDYNVTQAVNGLEGFDTAKKTIPDLIVSDVMMPKMDGYELCEKLKTNETTDHIPVILLTAKASQDSKIEGLQTGADAYLTKPFDEKELFVRIKNLIDLREKVQKKCQKESFLPKKDVKITSVQQKFLQKMKDIIEENIDNDQFTVEELGVKLFMSRSQVHRKLKAITDSSATEFIRNYRLHRAASLLKLNSGNVTEIAYQVGFSSQTYFSKSFQKLFGISPSEFKNNN